MLGMKNELLKFLEEGADWEKMETNIPSVFVVRSSPTKTKGARLYVEINPVDEKGTPRKRKGLFLTDLAMLDCFAEVILDENVRKLISLVEELVPNDDSKDKKKLNLK